MKLQATHHKHKLSPGCTRTAQDDPPPDTTRSRRRAGTPAHCNRTKFSSKSGQALPNATYKSTQTDPRNRPRDPHFPPERPEADGDGDAVAGSGCVLNDELVRAGERHGRQRRRRDH
jgi:hypothetical protein